MRIEDAQQLLTDFLSPTGLDEFLDQTLTGGFRRIEGAGKGARLELLGPDPQALLRGAAHLAPRITFHSANPAGAPPSLRDVADAADFGARIDRLHAANYSVRFPDLRPLSPSLDALARALEMVLHQPVTASAFWSLAGIKAPVHYDDHDLIVIQLRGTKRWQIGTRPSDLPNAWKPIGEAAPELGPHETLDVRPGDVLYLPRGTFHTVESDAESLHLAIGFTPLTARDVLIAAIDHLSDLERDLRTTVGQRLALQLGGEGLGALPSVAAQGASVLLAACRSPGFLAQALQRRSSRAIAGMEALPSPPVGPVNIDTVLVQRSSGFCHLTATAETLDISYPGGRLSIHRGALDTVLFMIDTPRFRIGDAPGQIDDAVRLSLATRFLAVGLLEIEPAVAVAQRPQTANT